MTAHEQTWDLLAEVLTEVEYKREPPPTHPSGRPAPGYPPRFNLRRDDESNYAVLYIYTYNPNTYRPGEMRLTRHEFVVPVATYHKRQWTRWLVERIISIEVHETVENFFVNGERLYSPYHGNGWDPYAFWPEGDLVERAKAPGED